MSSAGSAPPLTSHNFDGARTRRKRPSVSLESIAAALVRNKRIVAALRAVPAFEDLDGVQLAMLA